MPSLFIYHYQRDNLENANIQSWFNIFAISEHAVMMLFCGFYSLLAAFEIVSAYGSVGLSLGIPDVRLR